MYVYRSTRFCMVASSCEISRGKREIHLERKLSLHSDLDYLLLPTQQDPRPILARRSATSPPAFPWPSLDRSLSLLVSAAWRGARSVQS